MTSIDSGLVPASVPEDDDLETELLPLRRRRRLPLLTAFLALAAVAGGAFVGGVEIQKHYGASGGSTARTGAASAAAATARAGRGFFSRAGAAGGVTTGQVTLVKGSTLYVTDFSGNTVKVTTSGARVTKSVTANAKSISPGDTVVVAGTTQANGTIAARTISLGGASSGFGGSSGSSGGATGFGGGSGATGFGGKG